MPQHPLAFDGLAVVYGLTGDMRETFLLNASKLRPIADHDEIAVARMILDRVRDGRIATPDELGMLFALLERADDEQTLDFFASLTRGVEDLHAEVVGSRFDAAMPSMLAQIEAQLGDPAFPPEQRSRLQNAADALKKAMANTPTEDDRSRP